MDTASFSDPAGARDRSAWDGASRMTGGVTMHMTTADAGFMGENGAMQHLDERHYRATRARIHIFRVVLDGLEAHPDDDLPEANRRDRVETVRGQLHELESDFVNSVAGISTVPTAPARLRASSGL